MADKKKSGSSLRLVFEIFAVTLKLGLTSFGGPIAHLGYFYNEYIIKRKWMDENSYADLVALCQFLPGPASSQLGIGIGTIRAGLMGGITAWLGFTLPSFIALVLFAFLLKSFNVSGSGWIHGLKIVAVAIVAQAVISMGQKLTPDRNRVTIAITAMVIILLWHTAFVQIILIFAGGLFGLWLYRKNDIPEVSIVKVSVSRKTGIICLIIFFLLLVLFPILRQITGNQWFAVTDSFYRTGSLVFGGGHVRTSPA